MLSRPGASTAGRLRLRLALEKATPMLDGAGGATLAWSSVATVSADVVPLKAEERTVGEGFSDVVSHRIVIRHRSDALPGDRFRLGARVFAIKGVTDPEEDGRWLVCLCGEEGVA
ncbi:MAG: phage head closure protein [Propylenella sp.]